MSGLANRRLVLLAGVVPHFQLLAQTPPFMLGVVPNISARALVAMYQPLRSFLEGRLERPVQIVTAPDMGGFQSRAAEGQYELFITTANLGALAAAEDKARILGVFEPGVPALAVARRGTGDSALAALRGRRLALANPASLVSLRGLAWLKERGLEEGVDFEVVRVANEDSLARWLDSGDAPLALMSRGEYLQLNEGRRQALDVVHQVAVLPGFFAMVPSRVTAADAMRLKQVLIDFFASPAADAFRASGGMRSMRDLTRLDQAQLEPFIEPTRRALQTPR